MRVLCEGNGISRRGTNDNSPFSGDVIRKMLESKDSTELISWYNKVVVAAYLRQAKYKPCIHILDCTELEVNIKNENYEGSGVVSGKKKKGKDEEDRTR